MSRIEDAFNVQRSIERGEPQPSYQPYAEKNALLQYQLTAEREKVAQLEREVGMLMESLETIRGMSVGEIYTITTKALSDTQATDDQFKRRIKAEALREAAARGIAEDFASDCVCSEYAAKDLLQWADEIEKGSNAECVCKNPDGTPLNKCDECPR